MKKIIFFLNIVLLMAYHSKAQIAYYDAIALKGYIKSTGKFGGNPPNDPTGYIEILKNYIEKDKRDDIKNMGDLYQYLDSDGIKNVFLIDFCNNSSLSSEDDRQLPTRSIFTSVAGLDVTKYGDGLAKFLVERTKEELSIAFFERFKNDLDNFEEIRILFPTTYQTLNVIDQEVYNFAAYLDLLRESLQKDMITIIPNIRKLVNDPVMADFFKKYPPLKTILSDALYVIHELDQGIHPAEAIHNYISYEADKGSLEQVNSNLFPGLQTFDLFSASLRTKQDDQYWLSADSLSVLFKDDVLLRIYFGLIYQQAKLNNISFGDTALTTYLGKMESNFNSLKRTYQPYLSGLINRGKAVDQTFKIIKELQQRENTKPTYVEYFALYDAFLNFFEYAKQYNQFIGSSKSFDLEVEKYFKAMRGIGNIYLDVNQKQYASAVVEVANVYKTIIVDTLRKASDAESTKHQQILDTFVKYGNFAAIMTKAETSDEVKKAIEAVALPSGSSRIKRESKFNAAINAFVGPYAGTENIPISGKNNFHFSTGLAAPVGVAFSWGIAPEKLGRKGASLSLFFSLIDIGALTSFRFQDDSTETAPQVQLKDIFSPGAFLILGLPKSPVSISLGNQLGPRLHEVTAQEANSVANFYYRLSLSVLVDIPLLNLSTKQLGEIRTKKRKKSGIFGFLK